jgi:hypothetical protein
MERISVYFKPWELLPVRCKPWQRISVRCKPRVYANKAYGQVELLLQPHIKLNEMEQLVSFGPQHFHPLRKECTTPTEQEDEWHSETLWNFGLKINICPISIAIAQLSNPQHNCPTHIPVVQPTAQVSNPKTSCPSHKRVVQPTAQLSNPQHSCPTHNPTAQCTSTFSNP